MALKGFLLSKVENETIITNEFYEALANAKKNYEQAR